MVIGITGGVGSGKSTITDTLHEKYGYRVLRTDDMAKELELPGHAVYDALITAFGEGILVPQDENSPRALRMIDKAAFGALIYDDPTALKIAEDIIHPATWGWCEEIIREEREKAAESGAAMPEGARIVVESALPCDRYRRMCDEIWFVYVEKDIRIARLRETRGYSLEKCRKIMAEQLSDNEFLRYADHVIDNSAELEVTLRRVDELMEGSI